MINICNFQSEPKFCLNSQECTKQRFEISSKYNDGVYAYIYFNSKQNSVSASITTNNGVGCADTLLNLATAQIFKCPVQNVSKKSKKIKCSF